MARGKVGDARRGKRTGVTWSEEEEVGSSRRGKGQAGERETSETFSRSRGYVCACITTVCVSDEIPRRASTFSPPSRSSAPPAAGSLARSLARGTRNARINFPRSPRSFLRSQLLIPAIRDSAAGRFEVRQKPRRLLPAALVAAPFPLGRLLKGSDTVGAMGPVSGSFELR